MITRPKSSVTNRHLKNKLKLETNSKINQIDNLKKFPSLFMEHHEFNYTFEFTYEDLFLEKDNNYYKAVLYAQNNMKHLIHY